MVIKNYLTKEEQNVWEYIKEKEIIDNELVSQIFPEINRNKRNKILHNLYKKGYIQRARKDLYYNPISLNSYYTLASEFKKGYVGLSSALRYYNLIEYEDFTIFIITQRFQKKIELKGTKYLIQFVPLHNLFTGFIKRESINVSTIEKTLFDCMIKPQLVGLSNITKAFYEAIINKKISWEEFLKYFKLTKNNSLCQRTGYLLDLLRKNKRVKIPIFVFDYLLKRVKNPVKLLPIKGKSKFNKKWGIQDNLSEENIVSW